MSVEPSFVPGISALFAPGRPVVLAVSGGRDSMVLLDAVARFRVARAGEGAALPAVVVATFDHRTGPHASEAVDVVRRAARHHALPVVVGRARAGIATSEGGLRAARWQFLRAVAARRGAIVATAHTRDDQLETVVMRELRGAGARGLAALFAPSPVARPLLELSRGDVARYAARHGVEWLEDPSNASRRYLRNRVRHDLIPALLASRPSLADDLLRLSREASALRARLRDIAHPLLLDAPPPLALGGVAVMREALAGLGDAAALLWQEVASMAGVTLDRRGTRRLAADAATLADGKRIPLSGGVSLLAHRGALSFRRSAPSPERGMALGLESDTLYGVWRFSRVSDATINEAAGSRDRGVGEDPWVAWLPIDRRLEVRRWRPGDRLVDPIGLASFTGRRVKRFFADRHIAASDREGWPVVVAGDDVVWVPGIRRSRAATARPGRPGVCIRCERLDL